MRAFLFPLLAIFMFLSQQALATGVDENRFKDQAEEAHARKLMGEFRCLVCQNESIVDSDAPLAADLRAIVRDRIRAGDSDAEVRAYLTARYGDWVLLKPPFKASTYILWIGPFLLLFGAGLFLAFRSFRSARYRTETNPLTAAEKKRLEEVLKDQEGSQS